MRLVVDAWTNVQSQAAAQARIIRGVLTDVTKFFGDDRAFEVRTFDDVIEDLDRNGVDIGVVSASARVGHTEVTSNYSVVEALSFSEARADRIRVAMLIDGLDNIRLACDRIEEHAGHPNLAAVQIVPLTLLEPINCRRLYPLYERCEALGLPVSINVGVPGPKVSARLQDPRDLDDVLLDFPDLIVIAAHMGHPWESLLISFMRKFENLFLMNSAYLASYMTAEVVAYMRSSVGRTRVIFASDAPFISLKRAVGAARALSLPDESMEAFLGGNAARLFGLEDPRSSPAQITESVSSETRNAKGQPDVAG